MQHRGIVQRAVYFFELLRAVFSVFLRGLSIGQALVEFFCVSRANFLKSLETQKFAHSPVRLLWGQKEFEK